MLLNVHEDPNNVNLTRLKLTHVEPQGGGGVERSWWMVGCGRHVVVEQVLGERWSVSPCRKKSAAGRQGRVDGDHHANFK